MRFAEEIMLMLLHDESGYLVPVPEWQMSCALAGAVLMDLSIENRIDTDLETLTVIDPTPTGDQLLDPTLEQIVADTEVHNSQYWVERIAQRTDDIGDLALERLVAQDILEFDSGGFWSLSKKVLRTGRYPTLDGRAGEEIKSRIMRVLLDGELPDPRDLVIIGLVHFCGAFRALLSDEDFQEAEERIELFANMDLIGRSIGASVRSAYRPPQALRKSRGKPVPEIGIMDMLRSPTCRSLNLPKIFAEFCEKLGPVMKLKVPGRELYVLAGREMNLWATKKGRLHLRSQDYLEQFQACWGTARSIASMDGAEHYRMRKAARAGNSRVVIEERISDVYDQARTSLREWGLDKTLVGEDACQQLIGEQISKLSCSINPPPQVLKDLLEYEYRALYIHVMNILPAFTLRTPSMKRKRAKIMQLYADIHSSHSAAQREGKRRDLVDDMMQLHFEDPQYLPETDLGFAFIAPIIAGHYLGSQLNFAIHDMLTHPDLMAQMIEEVDKLFASGDPAASEFVPSNIDITQRFIMESMRLHPVIPMHSRTAMNAFEVQGMEIPAGSTVLVAFNATHYMEENFAEPDKFDIERFAEPRSEQRSTGAYTPFGVGTHTCMGSRWTELHLAINLLLVLRHLSLQMVPANYKLKINPIPKSSPRRSFKFKVSEVRNPL